MHVNLPAINPHVPLWPIHWRGGRRDREPSLFSPAPLRRHGTSNWPPPLITPSKAHPTYLPGIILGVQSNARTWCRTWAGEFLSLTVWLQVAILSGYTKKRLVRAAHSAVVRGLSTSPHDYKKTVQYLYKVIHHNPMLRCCAVTLCMEWLQKNAQWRGACYSSWMLPESLSPDGTTRAWCGDWSVLRTLAASDTLCHRNCSISLPPHPPE